MKKFVERLCARYAVTLLTGGGISAGSRLRALRGLAVAGSAALRK